MDSSSSTNNFNSTNSSDFDQQGAGGFSNNNSNQQQQGNPFYQQQQQQQAPFGQQQPGGMPGQRPTMYMTPMQFQQMQQTGQVPGFGAPQQGGAANLGGQPQQQMMGQPQQMMQPQQFLNLLGAGGGGEADKDYFRGFYEGVVRNGGSTNFGSVMSWVGPLAVNMALIFGPIWYLRRRYVQSLAATASGKAAAGGNPIADMMNPLKPKKYKVEVKGTKFGDVIGIPEAKEDLKQYVDFLQDPKKFTRLGARLPKGCLLTGQPGTGKTLLAKAIAGEADKPFLSCSGADFIEIFGGSGPKRVRELFAEAKECAPCIVFIDEIDAIGSRNSGRGMGGGSSEENRTINQLLAELDGLSTDAAIVVVAATNFPDNIDKALLREGRFDRKVNIPMPDSAARNELFNFYLKQIVTGDAECRPRIVNFKPRGENKEDSKDGKKDDEKKGEEVNEHTKVEFAKEAPIVVEGVKNIEFAKTLSDRTPGVSPAQIATIVNEAALTSAVQDDKTVTLKSLQDAIDDVLIGKKHRQRMGEKSLRRTAYHECGHAYMAWFSPVQQDVIKVTVIPRGRAGGYTQQVQNEALDPQTNKFLFSQLCMLLGGRVAERVFFGDISTGAVDDLQRATKIAMDKLLSYGMSKEIGHLAYKPQDKTDGRSWMNFSEDLHSRVENEARELVNAAYQHTHKTLSENKDKMHALAEELLKQKEIHKVDIEKILGPRPPRADADAAKKDAAAPAAAVEA